MFQKAVQFAKDFWHSLPKSVQTIIVMFASAAGPVIWKTWSEPQSCLQWVCIKHTLVAAIDAGIASACAFHMRPGPGRQGGPPYEGS